MTMKRIAHALTPPIVPLALGRARRQWQARRGEEAWWHHNLLQRDPFVQYISYIIGGYLHPGNVPAFEYALSKMPAGGAVVEIGSFLGLSTNVLSYGLQKLQRDAPFFSCDPWRYGPEGLDVPQFSTDSPQFDAWSRELFVQNSRLFSHDRLPHTIEATSESFFESWKEAATVNDVFGREAKLGGPIAFAYIDGNHSYEASRSDFGWVDHHLLPGGIILFDDSADDSQSPGVRRTVAEVKRHSDYRLLFRSPNYCFLKTAASS